MASYIVKRILSLIPVLFVVSIVIFMIVHLTPGDPASVMLGEEASAEQIAELREQLGLNLPIYEQYIHWVGGVLKGDLGSSFFTQCTRRGEEKDSDSCCSGIKEVLSG